MCSSRRWCAASGVEPGVLAETAHLTLDGCAKCEGQGPDDVRQDDDDNRVPTREGAREAKRAALMIGIAARRRRVCQHLTDEEFTQLVSDMADTKLRCAAIDARAWPRRDGDDRATAEPPTAPT